MILKNVGRIAGLGLILAGVSTSALAHFQLLYGGSSTRKPGQPVDMAIVFTHPYSAGPNMEMGVPESFVLIHQRGESEPEKTDLSQYLEAVTWKGPENSAAAYRARIPGSLMRSMGDYTFALEPAPYYESSEDKYIQQIAKLVMNVGGVPGAWDQPVGLPTEIVPLDKPYANWKGGVFRGVVMSDGKPVPFAEIEIEYVNFAPDLEANAWAREPAFEAPHPSLELQSIRADANGTFVVGLPRAGWWGIGALGVGPDTEHRGKELSQDAVIWVEVTEMPG